MKSPCVWQGYWISERVQLQGCLTSIYLVCVGEIGSKDFCVTWDGNSSFKSPGLTPGDFFKAHHSSPPQALWGLCFPRLIFPSLWWLQQSWFTWSLMGPTTWTRSRRPSVCSCLTPKSKATILVRLCCIQLPFYCLLNLVMPHSAVLLLSFFSELDKKDACSILQAPSLTRVCWKWCVLYRHFSIGVHYLFRGDYLPFNHCSQGCLSASHPALPWRDTDGASDEPWEQGVRDLPQLLQQRQCLTGSAGWSLVLLSGRSPEPFNGQHSPGELFQVVKPRLLAWPRAEAGPVLVLKCQHRQVLSVPLAQGPELEKLCLVNWSRLHLSSRTQELSLAPKSLSG